MRRIERLVTPLLFPGKGGVEFVVVTANAPEPQTTGAGYRVVIHLEGPDDETAETEAALPGLPQFVIHADD